MTEGKYLEGQTKRASPNLGLVDFLHWYSKRLDTYTATPYTTSIHPLLLPYYLDLHQIVVSELISAASIPPTFGFVIPLENHPIAMLSVVNTTYSRTCATGYIRV